GDFIVALESVAFNRRQCTQLFRSHRNVYAVVVEIDVADRNQNFDIVGFALHDEITNLLRIRVDNKIRDCAETDVMLAENFPAAHIGISGSNAKFVKLGQSSQPCFSDGRDWLEQKRMSSSVEAGVIICGVRVVSMALKQSAE